ncbi:hypothetical protein A2U01_0081007, partial [Trifolium medium]|nr:hypothetical protein [Trifolium medium]
FKMGSAGGFSRKLTEEALNEVQRGTWLSVCLGIFAMKFTGGTKECLIEVRWGTLG